MKLRNTLFAGAALIVSTLTASAVFADTSLLNVSYDPTRELYKAVNEAFVKDWKAKSHAAALRRASTLRAEIAMIARRSPGKP